MGFEESQEAAPATRTVKRKEKLRSRKSSAPKKPKRTRTSRPYPAAPFSDALQIADAIQKFGSGQKVRRLTLLKQIEKSPTSSATQMLITNSGKYGLTIGSYSADWLELTTDGRAATASDGSAKAKAAAQFRLAIEGVPPFGHLYKSYVGKKMPTREVLQDALKEGDFDIQDPSECVDTFVVNAKYLGLLQTIAGAETLVSIDQVLDEIVENRRTTTAEDSRVSETIVGGTSATPTKSDWSRVCFMITPIGDDDSELRKHSDLFLNSIVEPALKEFDMHVVRADRIGEAGMITSQILEHVMRARLVIVDMSYHNPNVFYEMAIRHACRLPVVQIIRKADTLPFDVNQVRTVVIDTTDIYSLVPKLETYRAELAMQARAALSDAQLPSNPITIFFPGFKVNLPTG